MPVRKNEPDHQISPVSPLTVKDYQSLLASELFNIFPNNPVVVEWSAMLDVPCLYCPRLDVVVGPFATESDRFEQEYDYMMENMRRFINNMIEFHNHNVENLSWEIANTSFEHLKLTNRNARCLLAIEIENRVNRKHLIGGAVNAAALGRIGVAVAWNPEKLNAFIKLRRYLNFLSDVGKNSFNTQNLLILDPAQVLDSIENS
jgi:hypothetical protein